MRWRIFVDVQRQGALLLIPVRPRRLRPHYLLSSRRDSPLDSRSRATGIPVALMVIITMMMIMMTMMILMTRHMEM